MRTNDKKNTSAKKKLIPAVAMLTTSAIMLSTATYAWFTLNKTVEVQGLQMTATTADALEISLGSVTGTAGTSRYNPGTFTTDNNNFYKQPTDTDTEVSWTNLINVGEYYSAVTKLMPSSSDDGINFFKADDATNGGKTATSFSNITSDTSWTATPSSHIGLTAQTSLTQNGQLSDAAGDVKGYYVEFPVHLRTSQRKTTSDTEDKASVWCKMSITNKTAASAGKTADLYKAVRVAFIPVGDDGNIANTTQAASIICGADDNYYTTASNKPQAVSGTNTRSDVTVQKTVGSSDALETFDTNIDIDYATEGTFGHTDFIARVWLEGESSYCFDANAAQDWKIDFAFALSEASLTDYTVPSVTTTASTAGN